MVSVERAHEPAPTLVKSHSVHATHPISAAHYASRHAQPFGAGYHLFFVVVSVVGQFVPEYVNPLCWVPSFLSSRLTLHSLIIACSAMFATSFLPPHFNSTSLLISDIVPRPDMVVCHL
jgi:hypothetical protein